MEYLTIIGVAILVSILVGFYIFYCRLNDSNTRVKELERNIRILDETQGSQQALIQKRSKQLDQHEIGQNMQSQQKEQKQQNHKQDRGKEQKDQQNLSHDQSNTNYPNDSPNNSANNSQNPHNHQNSNSHGSIVAEKRNPVSICANSEPSEDSNNCTNYAPIPDEVDNVQLHSIENMSEYPVDLLG